MQFKNVVKIPLKYKFLVVLLLTTFAGVGVFYSFATQIFTDDKRMFLTDFNLNILRAATSEIKLEVRSRIEALQLFIPRLYRVGEMNPASLYEGLPEELSLELIRVRFLKETLPGKFEAVREYKNQALLEKRKLPHDLVNDLDARHPLDLKNFLEKRNLELVNRSIRLVRGDLNADLPIVTILLPGNFAEGESKEVIVAVDMFQDFLRKKLNISELAQLYLITSNGNIVSHSSLQATVEFASNPYLGPIVEKIQKRKFARDSFELNLEGEAYLINMSETGFADIFAVSQIRKTDAFVALSLLAEKSLLIGSLIFFIAVVIAVMFASRLSGNIQKLRLAAEQVGAGNLRLSLKIRSQDEVASVANSFIWMTSRLKDLIEDSARKARLEIDLAISSLVQSTLLSNEPVNSDLIDYETYYSSASERGGDIWDLRLDGNILTAYVGDATGHGTQAAMITAIAKSSFDTLGTIYQGQPLTPEQILSTLNYIIHRTCKGKLLMTMCIIQIHLETGEITVASAGHEAPLCMRNSKVRSNGDDADNKQRDLGTEVLFARGERLGYDPEAVYEGVRYQLGVDDTLLLYTDGITQAKNIEGKEFGERNLKRVMARVATKPATYIKEQLVTSLEEHTGGITTMDDVTLLVLGFRGKAAQTFAEGDAAASNEEASSYPARQTADPYGESRAIKRSGADLYGDAIATEEEEDNLEGSEDKTVMAEIKRPPVSEEVPDASDEGSEDATVIRDFTSVAGRPDIDEADSTPEGATVINASPESESADNSEGATVIADVEQAAAPTPEVEPEESIEAVEVAQAEPISEAGSLDALDEIEGEGEVEVAVAAEEMPAKESADPESESSEETTADSKKSEAA
jgi:serine phosphatase RsbU (regulator of sigma subunit)/HAMP domain-containing protein